MDDWARIRQLFSTGQHSKRESGRVVGVSGCRGVVGNGGSGAGSGPAAEVPPGNDRVEFRYVCRAGSGAVGHDADDARVGARGACWLVGVGVDVP